MDQDTQAIIDLARSSAKFETIAMVGKIQHVLVHGHGVHPSSVHAVNLEFGLDQPLRKRGEVTVFDAAAFNQVIKDNSDAGCISIYFDRNPEAPAVVAILNGNGTGASGVGEPGWGDFRVKIEFRPTPQWTKWRNFDGKMLTQVAFAEFLEDNIDDIVEPSGAAMLEIASYLEIVRNVNFKSGIALSSGVVQFVHEQDDAAKVKANTFEVPKEFSIGVAPVFGLKHYRVPARFRYRLNDGKLTLGYKLQRIENVMGLVVEEVIAAVERGADISVLDGLPPAPTK